MCRIFIRDGGNFCCRPGRGLLLDVEEEALFIGHKLKSIPPGGPWTQLEMVWLFGSLIPAPQLVLV